MSAFGLLRRLSPAAFEELIRGAGVVTRDSGGPKLLRRRDGRMVKVFRRRRLISSSVIWPVALRFCRAARRLAALGVPSVTVEAAYRVPEVARHAVVYPEIQGTTLRDAIADPERRDVLLDRFARFLADLHAKGVYFRAIHFGNVVVREDGNCALVDISECRFRRAPLRLGLRARNFRPFFSYEEDTAVLHAFGLDRFLGLYCDAACLEPRARARFVSALARSLSVATDTPSGYRGRRGSRL